MGTQRYLWTGIAVLGFAAGVVIGKAGKTTPAPETDAPTLKGAEVQAAEERSQTLPAAPPLPLPVSQDSIDDLLAVGNAMDLYAPLGLWLIDASAADIEAFWSSYAKRKPVDRWIKELIFTQWAKKDVQRLFEIAKQDDQEELAWWAWAMSDPDAALAAAANAPASMRESALRGLANFHPERARKMIEEKPGLAQIFDVNEMAKELYKGDPEKQLEFLSKFNQYGIGAPLKAWAEQDPRAAFAWMKDRSGNASLRSEFVKGLARSHPDLLPELAAQLPSGTMKRDIELASLAHLAESDPDKALEQAGKADSPQMTADRLAKVANVIAPGNPEKALQVLAGILAGDPGALSRMQWTRTPGNGGTSGAISTESNSLLTTLGQWNPGLTMETLLTAERENPPSNTGYSGSGSEQLAKNWASQDFEGFVKWRETQEDPKLLDSGASVITRRLISQNDYEAAAQWARQITETGKQQSLLSETIANWVSKDREAAARWLDQAALPETTVNSLRKSYLPPQR